MRGVFSRARVSEGSFSADGLPQSVHEAGFDEPGREAERIGDAGRICGMIGTILTGVLILVWGVLFGCAIMAGA